MNDLGCSTPTVRPVCCRMGNNLCCRKCEHQLWCLNQIKKGLTGVVKTRPCVDNDFEIGETCQFAC